MRLVLYLLLLGLSVAILLSFSHPAKAVAQTSVTLSYNVTGDGPYQPPILNYKSANVTFSVPLTEVPKTYDMDYNSIWTVSRELPGSNNTLRWEFKGSPSGTASASYALVLNYYRQYLVTFGLSVVGGSKGMTPPPVTFSYLGALLAEPAGSSYWVDYRSSYNYGLASGNLTGVRWFAGAGPGTSGVVNGRFSVYPKFYKQYLDAFSLGTKGADVLPSVPLGLTELGVTSEIVLNGSGLSTWVDAGSGFSFTTVANSSSPDQRWSFHNATATIAGSPMSIVLSYYEQFSFGLSFTISDGSAPTAPILVAVSNGQQVTFEMFPNSPFIWADSGSSYSISSLLIGSSSGERWIALENTAGVVTRPTSVVLIYHHQVQVSFNYVAVGGGNPPAMDATFTSLGHDVTSPLTTAVSTAWADYGSNFTVPDGFQNPSFGGRWMLGSASSILLLQPAWLPFAYYHQYQLAFTFSVTNGGPVSQVNLTGTALGKQFKTSISSGTNYWLDGGSAWNVPRILGSAVTGERWAASGATNGTVGTAMPPPISYAHEFFVSLGLNAQAGGVVNQPGWVAAGSDVDLSAEPNDRWTFVGWMGSGTGSYTGPRQTATVTVSSPLNETADFDLAFTIEASGRGTLVVSYDSRNYTVTDATLTLYMPPGSNVTIRAEPGTLSLFDRWVGVPISNENPVVIKAAAPIQMTGVFVPNSALEYYLILVAWLAAIYVAAFLARRRGVSFSSFRRTISRRGKDID